MSLTMGVRVFFFQAEDGIRDLVRSRGLGDVYKRQGEPMKAHYLGHVVFYVKDLKRSLAFYRDLLGFKAVSYTHLTLPTSDLV